MSQNERQRQQQEKLLSSAYDLKFDIQQQLGVAGDPVERSRLQLQLEKQKVYIQQLEDEIAEMDKPVPNKPAKQPTSGGDQINATGAQGVINNPIYLTVQDGSQVDMRHVVNNLQPQGDIKMSDTFNMSGDFRGAILNIKNTLNNTTQTIGGMAAATPSDKDELKKLVEQLSTELQAVPAEKTSDAEKVAKRADELVKEAAETDADKDAVEAKGNLLLKAATNIAGVIPTVLPIAQQIVSFLGK